METAAVESSIRRSIQKGGFPEKTVRLPFKPVYESCRARDVALDQVLACLRAEGIDSRFEGDHIVFRAQGKQPGRASGESASPLGLLSWDSFAGPGAMLWLLRQSLANASPEQWEDWRQAAASLSEEERKKLFETFMRFSAPDSK